MARTTIVPPDGVSAAYDTTTPLTAQTRPMTIAQRIVERNDWPSSCAAAVGTIISALMSSSPTMRIDTTTVTAVSTASAMLRASTGMPIARAYSSSVATANSRGRSSQVVRMTSTARTANTQRSEALTVVMAPKRYAVRLAGVPCDDLLMITTPAAMPP